MRDLGWRGQIIGAAVAAAMVLGACGSSNEPGAARPLAGSPASTTGPSQPRIVVAQPIPPNRFRPVRPGKLISKRNFGFRVFADARHGFALAEIQGEAFPATTVNAGRTWRVAGPVLFAPAADAPLAVTQVGTAGPRAYFAWGGGGSVVDITTDGGRRWWQAFLGENVLAVTITPLGLVAVAQQQTSNKAESLKATNWVYLSTDGGRRWRADDLLAAG